MKFSKPWHSPSRLWSLWRCLLIAAVAFLIYDALFHGGLTIFLFLLVTGGVGLTLDDFKHFPSSTIIVCAGLTIYATINAVAVIYAQPSWIALGFFALVGPVLFVVALVAGQLLTPLQFSRFTWHGIVMLMTFAFVINGYGFAMQFQVLHRNFCLTKSLINAVGLAVLAAAFFVEARHRPQRNAGSLEH